MSENSENDNDNFLKLHFWLKKMTKSYYIVEIVDD